MEIEEKILTDLGLSNTEAKIYLSLLELGSDTVLNIAKKAGAKRPTCYLNLDELVKKGYATKLEKQGTSIYTAEKPSILFNKYKEKLDDFKDLLPFYEAKFNRGSKPKIKFYEGVEALFDVFTKIIYPAEEIYFFGVDMEKINKVLPELLPYWFKNNANNKKQKMLEIITPNKAGMEYLAKYGKNNPKKKFIKFMPENLPVMADSVITENKIFIVSLDNLFGVLIESEDIAKTYKNFFLLAWQSAKDIG